MRQIFSIKRSAIAAMALIAAVACSKDTELNPTVDNQDAQTLLVNTAAPKTRVSFDENNTGFTLSWVEGDKISIFNGAGTYNHATFEYKSSIGGFEKIDGENLTEWARYQIVYPATEAATIAARNDEAIGDVIQIDDSKQHLKNIARMSSGEFQYKVGEVVSLAHDMVYFTHAFYVDGTKGSLLTKVQLQIQNVDTPTEQPSYKVEIAESYGGVGLKNVHFALKPDGFASKKIKLNGSYDGEEKTWWNNETTKQYTAGYSYTAANFDATWSQIYTKEDLIAFQEKVNSGTYNANAVMLQNVELTENWIPIASNTNKYTGKFYGNGKTITGLKINTGADYQGLFAAIVGTAEVRDITIVEPEMAVGANSGVVVGISSWGSLIYNCKVIGGSISSTKNNIGGIIGSSSRLVQECYNSASVSGAKFVGGIAGVLNHMDAKNGIYASQNEGAVTGTDSAGGVVGGISHLANENQTRAQVVACYNSGDVNTQSTSQNSFSSGGVVGANGVQNSTNDRNGGDVIGCYSVGTVNKTGNCHSNFLGGVIGHDFADAKGGTISENYYSTSDKTDIGKNDTRVDDINSEVSKMNVAISSYGYKYVQGSEGTNPSIEKL